MNEFEYIGEWVEVKCANDGSKFIVDRSCWDSYLKDYKELLKVQRDIARVQKQMENQSGQELRDSTDLVRQLELRKASIKENSAVYDKELNTENPYNTRATNMVGKLPVGPICNPSKEAIEAVFNYKETDALYFVADKNGKVYFTKTNEEHNKMIKTLKSEGLWFTY